MLISCPLWYHDNSFCPLLLTWCCTSSVKGCPHHLILLVEAQINDIIIAASGSRSCRVNWVAACSDSTPLASAGAWPAGAWTQGLSQREYPESATLWAEISARRSKGRRAWNSTPRRVHPAPLPERATSVIDAQQAGDQLTHHLEGSCGGQDGQMRQIIADLHWTIIKSAVIVLVQLTEFSSTNYY